MTEFSNMRGKLERTIRELRAELATKTEECERLQRICEHEGIDWRDPDGKRAAAVAGKPIGVIEAVAMATRSKK